MKNTHGNNGPRAGTPLDTSPSPVADSAGARGDGHGGGSGHGGGRLGAPIGAEVFGFDIQNGAVAGVSRVVNGTTVSVSDNADGSYSVSGADVVLTRTSTRGQELVVFSDADADGLYAITSQVRITTAAPVTDSDGHVHAEQLKATIDTATLTVSDVLRVLRDGSTVAIDDTEHSFSIDQGLLIETSTNTAGQTRWEIFRDGNADGVYTEVAEGAGALVDLVGVISLTDPIIDQL